MLQAVGDECQVLEVHEEVFGVGDGSLGCRVVAAPDAVITSWRAALAKSRAMWQGVEETPPAWVYSYNAGVEVEAAGRPPAKNWLTLRRDLAALPWLLAGPHDVVLAPPQRPAFLAALRASGAHGLPDFLPAVPAGRAIAGHRPYGVPGEHLRRSLVARWREDVAVCRTSEEVGLGLGLGLGLG